MRYVLFRFYTIVLVMILSGVASTLVYAHCDTLDGPVVLNARDALERGDVTPVLKWVKIEQEAYIRDAFQKTLAVRSLGPEARELADLYFFETLVRIHRAGEGAPYTGLKPAGSVEPAIAKADNALESGSIDHLAGAISSKIKEAIETRFEHAFETKQHADESIESGREYVAAYVEFVHYVERLHQEATASSTHHAPEQEETSHH